MSNLARNKIRGEMAMAKKGPFYRGFFKLPLAFVN